MIKPLFANGNGDSSVESNSLPAELPYSATSLVDHRITLQQGDAVSDAHFCACTHTSQVIC